LSRGPSLKDELAELVREDPDAAASILRNWISNAS
jgi:flagellar biosynthesis/type III secretory pathway M-ring protein FliF/YscJ